MNLTFPDIIGILGVTLVVIAYFLITNGRLTGKDIRFHLINFVGAAMIMFSLMFNWNSASVLIETVWLLISLYGIFSCLKARRS